MVRRASFQTRHLRCISAARSQDHCMYHGSSLATCSGGNKMANQDLWHSSNQCTVQSHATLLQHYAVYQEDCHTFLSIRLGAQEDVHDPSWAHY